MDDLYQSKRQQKKFIRAALVKARVNVVHIESSQEAKPIDDPISFALINPNRVIVPHYDALVLTLFINGFFLCIGCWWIQAVRQTCCNSQPSHR